MEERETTGVGWFIAGLGLGALLGVLFAPKAGRELRDGLMSGARDSKEYVTSRGKQARDQVNSLVDRGRDQIYEYAERGKEVAEKGRERWSGIVDRVAGQSEDEDSRSSRESDEPFRGGTAEDRY
jgi:gas vesicle protein